MVFSSKLRCAIGVVLFAAFGYLMYLYGLNSAATVKDIRLNRDQSLSTQLTIARVDASSGVDNKLSTGSDNMDAENAKQANSQDNDSSKLARVREMLFEPSTLPYNFKKYKQNGHHWGQAGQDAWVDQVFKKARDLFVVESGGYDGEAHSNSVFFETQRGWACLLIEANPHLAEVIRTKNRKCYLLKGGISLTGDIGSFPFKLAGPLGGFTQALSKGMVARQDSEIKAKQKYMAGDIGSGKVVDVQAFPLHLVLTALGRKTIDYWSLDTEGSELSIVLATDFQKIEVGVMTIEHNGEKGRRDGIRKHLELNGFKRVVGGGQDDYYANIAYFQKRGMKFPGR